MPGVTGGAEMEQEEDEDDDDDFMVTLDENATAVEPQVGGRVFPGMVPVGWPLGAAVEKRLSRVWAGHVRN